MYNEIQYWKSIYGPSFKPIMEIVKDEIWTQEEADYWERFFVQNFKQNHPELSLNVYDGGLGGKGYKHSEETRRRMSKAQIKMNKEDPTRHDFKKIKIRQYSIDGKYIQTFDSISDAAKSVNSPVSNIEACLLDPENHFYAHGYRWYPDNGKHYPLLRYPMPGNTPKKPVLQIDINTGEVVGKYESLHEASRQTGINRKHISECIRGINHYKTAGGYVWKYNNE